jgi:primosomal protein N' (replication factor Y)
MKRPVKPITQLVDETPLVNEEILALTKWTADYYAASWGEMLKASLRRESIRPSFSTSR